MGRIINSKRNIITGFIQKILSLLFPFLIRTLIIYKLGVEYLGLGSLFTSILSMLSLTDLGFASAIVYSMYKPIADHDDKKICALLAYYKKVYHIVGVIIGILGLSVLPFLPKLIKGSYPSDINIYILYLAFLFNVVIGYFLFAYRTSVITAFERSDLINKNQIILQFLQAGLQILALSVFSNYYCYVFVIPLITIIGNILNFRIAVKYFPQYKPEGKLEEEDKKNIFTKVKGLFLDRLGDASRNSFDNIVISAFFGLSTLAIFNNYYYLVSAVTGILLVIKAGAQSSIGNSIAAESVEKNYSDFIKFSFMFGWIITFCTVCFLCLYQPFMELWVGKELTLTNNEMLLFCIFFYAYNINHIPNLYFAGNGLWWQGRYACIAESLGNLALNIILGKLLGIKGILIATIFTLLCFNYIWRNKIMFKEYFRLGKAKYYRYQLLFLIVTVILCIISFFICSLVQNFIIKMAICILIPNLLMFIIYFKLPLFGEVIQLTKKILIR